MKTNPAAQCWGKEGFQTPQLARQVAERGHKSRKRRGKADRPATPYRCAHCGLFHLGRAL